MKNNERTSTYDDRWDNSWVAQPEGFNSPVRIRRIVTRTGQARFQYWGKALRWLPISRDVAAMAIAEAVAAGQTPAQGE
jgi:hypothetical protein